MNAATTKTYTAIGLISGTSADGIDAALIRIASGSPPKVEVLKSHSFHYPAGLRNRVLAAAGEPGVPTPEICSLHQEIGEEFACAAMSLLETLNMEPNSVDFIGSHGQTVCHLPEKGKDPKNPLAPSTLQIGDPAVIAERTGCTVISDFRARDVAAGGMGAPLTPWAHRILFGQSNRPVGFLNLGGISNLTYIPQNGKKGLFGFDAGPANMTLDALAKKFSGGKKDFDKEGATAARGRVRGEALAHLTRHPYLDAPVPKSTGRETFGESFLAWAVELPGLRGARPEDQLATMCEFSAECIVRSLREIFPANAPPAKIIAGGGGVHNKTLMTRLKVGLAPIPLVSSKEEGISPDEVEAVSFALLAWSTIRGEPANVPEATGAKRRVVLGNITPGRNYLSIL